MSSRWHDFLEQPRKLSEGTDPGVQVPARQRIAGTKRYNHDSDDGHEPKRFRMSDIPQDDIARPIRTSGFLAFALFGKDRNISDASMTVDQNSWYKGLPYHNTPRRRPDTAGFFREQRRLVLEGVHGIQRRNGSVLVKRLIHTWTKDETNDPAHYYQTLCRTFTATKMHKLSALPLHSTGPS